MSQEVRPEGLLAAILNPAWALAGKSICEFLKATDPYAGPLLQHREALQGTASGVALRVSEEPLHLESSDGPIAIGKGQHRAP